jgi:hypothetical protein
VLELLQLGTEPPPPLEPLDLDGHDGEALDGPVVKLSRQPGARLGKRISRRPRKGGNVDGSGCCDRDAGHDPPYCHWW